MSFRTQEPPEVSSFHADYVDSMYARWVEDPTSLSLEWQMFFKGFELAKCPRVCIESHKAQLQSQVASLIYAYRDQGHKIATLDPLGNNLSYLEELDPKSFGFTNNEMHEVFSTGHLKGPKRATLQEIIDILKDTYCRNIGVEYLHIQERNIRRWLQNKMEPIRNLPKYGREKTCYPQQTYRR